MIFFSTNFSRRKFSLSKNFFVENKKIKFLTKKSVPFYRRLFSTKISRTEIWREENFEEGFRCLNFVALWVNIGSASFWDYWNPISSRARTLKSSTNQGSANGKLLIFLPRKTLPIPATNPNAAFIEKRHSNWMLSKMRHSDWWRWILSPDW